MSIKKSFSLIEVLIFVTILSVFLITAAAIITVSMRQNVLRINMLKAEHYNEQLLEWIKGEKEVDWNEFVANADGAYCFLDSDIATWPIGAVDTDYCQYSLGGMYRRYAIFAEKGSPPSQVEATIITEWKEGDTASYSAKLHTLFTIWEQ